MLNGSDISNKISKLSHEDGFSGIVTGMRWCATLQWRVFITPAELLEFPGGTPENLRSRS